MKFKALLKSRKFWAGLVGLAVVALDATWPGFPFNAEQVTDAVVVIAGYILGTAIEDHGKKG